MFNSTSEDLKFTLLPAYAAFILDHKIEEYVAEQIKLSRKLNLPILKYFEDLAEEDLIKVSMQSSSDFLKYFVDNNAYNLIQESIQQWLKDDLPQNIGRNELSAEDITLISFIRKQSLLKFAAEYSSDMTVIMGIIAEIDTFILHSDSIAFETYRKIMDEKINEHVHFIEKIAETSPGIVYVYDLIEGKEIYSNGKAREMFGYTSKDLETISWQDLQHPEDLDKTVQSMNEITFLGDNDISVFEHRVKKRDGNYGWLRDYLSVFKRDENGKPIQIIGLSLDIDKEKSLGEELLNREEQLLEAQELAEIGSFLWHLKDDSSVSTPQLKKLLELDDNGNLGLFMDRIHPYDKKQVEAALDMALKTTGKYDAEFRYFGKDKTTEKVLWSRGVITYEAGQPKYMRGTVMDVTERTHMIQRLKRSEELYKQAQSLTHIGNWTYELSRNKITWTDELYRIFNLAPQSIEIKFNDLPSYLHPKDKELFEQTLKHVDKLSPDTEYFPKIILQDGSIKYLSVKAEVIKDEHGNVFKLIGTAQDITQQKLNEKKLRQNQNFIQKITDATPSIIGAYNIHTGKYLFVNRAFEKLLGYKAEDVLQQGASLLMKIIHPDDLEFIRSQNEKALVYANKNPTADASEIVVDFKYRLQNINGEYRWLHTYGTVFDRNEKNEVEHVLNVSIDITDKVNAEAKVLEQENFIEHIADASPMVLYLFDTKTDSVVYINHEITPVLGYTPDEVIGMGSLFKEQMFHPDDQAKVGSQATGALSGKAFSEYECRMKQKDGTWNCLLIREIAFKQDTKGAPTQVLCAALDISDRKKIEETLYHKTMELQQSNSSLEEFAYVASHDLKEPLRKITTFGDRLLAKEKESLKEDSQVYLQKIIESSRRMQRMIDDLLSISMISGEKTFDKISLKTILDEVVQTLEFKVEENNAIIEYGDLPIANIITSQFRQLFQNLISNSLKFSRPDVQPTITITHRHLKNAEIEKHNLNTSKKYLQLNFDDNGIGFDDRYAEKIFSIFHRLHGRSEYEGTGIGLAICKKIVENHSGRIYATGKENVGSTFSIIIPA